MGFSFSSIVSFIAGAALVVVGVVTEQPSLIVMGTSLMASSVISATTPAPSPLSSGTLPQLNTSTNIQIPPATGNKLPVVYGQAYVGGTIVDLSISSNNQELYYVIALCEVTGDSTDNITIGKIFYGGKELLYTGTNVTGLKDPSTGIIDTSVANYMSIYLYANGSNVGINTSTSAITVMQASGLTYTWNSNKLMSNTVFAIIHLTYNANANTTSLQQTQFEIINPRNRPGNVLLDYLTNTVYGAAIPLEQIDTASLDALNTYSSQLVTFTNSSGGTSTQPRFTFNGVIDNKQNILINLQNMTSCCDCLLKYNEIYGLWSVIVQSTSYTVAMNINNSNLTGAISISTMDISNVYNIAQCQFPDLTLNGSFNTSTLDLAEVDPALLYPNEPQNIQTIQLPMVNNNVQAQLLANRFLKAARLSLTVQATVNYIGLELEAGDVVTVTNANYGWTDKLFRLSRIDQNFASSGEITVNLVMQEYDPEVYSDTSITQYQPPLLTGLSNPDIFGTIPVPVISGVQENATVPSFQVNITTSEQGTVQYAEIWYSAYYNPTDSQRIFAGTTAVQPAGTTYGNNEAIPASTLTNIPAGDWYFFTRMVNSVATSSYSAGSDVLKWRPYTFQYAEKYLVIAYADTINGGGFNLNPRGKAYFGLLNQDNTTPSTTASDYQWYLASPSFSTINYLAFVNRGNRLMSFGTGTADYAAGSALFVPSNTALFDPSIWSALQDGTNYIDLDNRTGQLIQTGTTTVGTGEIAVTNNTDGTIVAALQPFLNFGTGIYQKTTAVSNLTVDIYGRVVGFEQPDSFNYSTQIFTATSEATVFSVTRGTGYITGQCWVFENGMLLSTSEYTDSSSAVTFATGRTAGDIITVVSFKSISSVSLVTTATSGTGSTATITFGLRSVPPFTVGQSITVAGVTPSGYNGTYTVTGCTTSTVSYANATTGSQTVSGTIVATSPYYPSFSRNTATLTNTATYTASGFTLVSGYELLFLNGSVLNQNDYNIVDQSITFLSGLTSGSLQIIQWSNNNLGVPNGTPVNVIANTVIGQVTYPFSFDSNAFNIYNNGSLLVESVDYTTSTGSYTLTNTPVFIDTLLQQTFTRNGAV